MKRIVLRDTSLGKDVTLFINHIVGIQSDSRGCVVYTTNRDVCIHTDYSRTEVEEMVKNA